MSTDLVPAANMAALDALDPETRELAITSALEQANSWLAHVDRATEPVENIANFRAYVITVAEASRRLKVSKECQVRAGAVVRHSERTLGLSIREGQERGEIARTGQQGGRAVLPPHAHQPRSDSTLLLPSDLVGKSELSGNDAGIYHLTDGVTDEQFEVAVEVAQEEGNISRANVVRKIREIAEPSTYREQQDAKWARVVDMAERGYTSPQIAREVDMSYEGLRLGAKKRGIDIRADRVVGKVRRLDTNRIIRQSVIDLEGIAAGLALINPDDIDQDEAQTWVDSLNQSIKAIAKARTVIKESLQ